MFHISIQKFLNQLPKASVILLERFSVQIISLEYPKIRKNPKHAIPFITK